jgi:putative tryptophan/tyrosine transport system substrate-binding protein
LQTVCALFTLKEAGYVAGDNVALDYSMAEGDYDRLPGLALAMVRRQVSVIVTGANPGCLASPFRRPCSLPPTR